MIFCLFLKPFRQVRKIEVTNEDGAKQIVKHIIEHSWPDNCKPDEVLPEAEMYDRINYVVHKMTKSR